MGWCATQNQECIGKRLPVHMVRALKRRFEVCVGELNRSVKSCSILILTSDRDGKFDTDSAQRNLVQNPIPNMPHAGTVAS